MRNERPTAGGEGLAVRVVPGDEGREGRLGLALGAGHPGEAVVGEADVLPEGSDAAPGHGLLVLGSGRRGDAGLGDTGPIGTGPLSDERARACESGRGQEDADGRTGERGMEGCGFHGLVPLVRDFSCVH
jgi:hypothetical protein